MSYDPQQPRLLADYAATPTRTERAGARRHWRQAQTDLFAAPACDADCTCRGEVAACACCGSPNHSTAACPHGQALALDLIADQTAGIDR